MTTEALRERCATLYRELATEYHRAGAGLQEGLDTTAILDRHADLATRDVVAQVAAAHRAAREPVEARRLALLLEHLAWLYDAHAGRAVNDRLQHDEAACAVSVDGETVPYRALLPRIVNEPDRTRRLRLAALREAAQATFEPLHLEHFQRTQQTARDLGFANHAARCATLGELPLDELRGVAQTILDATGEVYERALTATLTAAGVPPAEATWSDLGHLFRVTAWDHAFPADAMVSRITAMVADLGLDSRADGRIVFDLDERPLKSPRPFCSVIACPTEVILVLRPVGGLSDYASFLHELGHALHFAYADPAQPWEFRHLGDNAITESYAFVFDRLTVDPVWLADVGGLADPDRLAGLLALREAMMVRKYAAQLLWELDLFAGDDPLALKDSWARRIGQAVRARQAPTNWLPSVDPHFYCARYLQGWLFEALLTARLTAPGRGRLARPESV